jgi:hypothetical protein
MATLRDRFMAKVVKDPSGCWLWTGATKASGYGSIMIRSYVVDYAHRASWMIHYGDIPPLLNVCHKCDRPGCVNPEHLFLASQYDNMQDMVAKGRSAANKGKTPAHRAKIAAGLRRYYAGRR